MYNPDQTNKEPVSTSHHTHKVNFETKRNSDNYTINNADEETFTTRGFQQAPTITEPSDQIKEIISMIQVIMHEIQQLKQNSINKETKETSKLRYIFSEF